MIQRLAPLSESNHKNGPAYVLNITTPYGNEALIVCPRGANDCDRPEESAEHIFAVWRNKLIGAESSISLEELDSVRRLLIAAEPYRQSIPPADNCAQESAPHSRIELIEDILKFYGGRARYLEIGCSKDETFNRVRAGAGSALCVDPATGGTHRMTSDTFFSTKPGLFDVVFVDGLHEAKQAERDINNALVHLAPGGVIVVHDCNPRVQETATWPQSHFGTAWNGDTFKTCVKFGNDPAVEAVTADIDYGTMILRPRPSYRPILSTITLPAAIDWTSFDARRNDWLHLMASSDALRWFAEGREGPARVGVGTTGVERVQFVGGPPSLLTVGNYTTFEGTVTIHFEAGFGSHSTLGLAFGGPSAALGLVVGSDCHIGTGAVLYGGIQVGNGAIVEPFAVVSADVPPFGIAQGNPAAITRFRFDSMNIASLMLLAWWRWPMRFVEDSFEILASRDVASLIAYAVKTGLFECPLSPPVNRTPEDIAASPFELGNTNHRTLASIDPLLTGLCAR